MNRLLLLTIVSAILAPTFGYLPKPLLDGRIVGGFPINITEAPYQLSLRKPHHSCGAILLSRNWVLTAAHCTTGDDPSSYQVYMGSANNLKDGLSVDVIEVHRHPKYGSLDYDFSLLRLAEFDPIGWSIAGVLLPEQDEEIPDGTLLRVSGWGNTQEPGDDRSQLRAAHVAKVNWEECNKAYADNGGISERMLCAGFPEGGKDSCQGDSGGPLTWDHKLAGVVSWGYGCAQPNYPGVYANPAKVRDWIKSVSGI